MKYLIYILFPICIGIITCLGIMKKNRIINLLKFKVHKKTEIIKGLLFIIGGIFVFVALLSPQKLIEEEKQEVKGLDIYILIDTSNSMMVEDVYPTRLARAKQVIEEVLNDLKGDRIGIIPFSDSAYVQLPLTDDYTMANNYIDAIDTTLISGGGTELLSAIKLAEISFKETATENPVVLIVSDGGDYNKTLSDYIKGTKLKIYSIGIGTKEGNIVPEYEKGKKIGFIKDKSGSAALSKLNSELLKDISGENYFEINNTKDESKRFVRAISNLERNNVREENLKNYRKYFQYPLFLGIILLLIAYLIKGGIRNEEK
ncbi:MAG: vWA domain-containing protein [Fusobacteriaceae bacterium]